MTLFNEEEQKKLDLYHGVINKGDFDKIKSTLFKSGEAVLTYKVLLALAKINDYNLLCEVSLTSGMARLYIMVGESGFFHLHSGLLRGEADYSKKWAKDFWGFWLGISPENINYLLDEFRLTIKVVK